MTSTAAPRPEWVEAGARAYISAPWGIDPVVTAVIAAVEPLIRAQIARDIEARYGQPNDVGPSDYELGLYDAARIARGES